MAPGIKTQSAACKARTLLTIGSFWLSWSVFFLAGIRKGDRVAIYMPMIPELVVAMLACARLGALHSIVVGIGVEKDAWGREWRRIEI